MLHPIGFWHTSGPTITLSGTSESSNVSNSGTFSTSGGSASWWFWTDGTVDRNNGSPAPSQFQDGVEWHSEQDSPTGDYWVSGTDDGGNLVPDDGATLGDWHKVLGTGSAYVQFTLAPGPGAPGVKSGKLKIEISSDSSGSPVVATGYYSFTMTYV